jgi:hypothetical protein
MNKYKKDPQKLVGKYFEYNHPNPNKGFGIYILKVNEDSVDHTYTFVDSSYNYTMTEQIWSVPLNSILNRYREDKKRNTPLWKLLNE